MSTIYQDTASDPWLLVADLRRQLEERTAERDEALDQQAAAVEVLQVINSSPGGSRAPDPPRRCCGTTIAHRAAGCDSERAFPAGRMSIPHTLSPKGRYEL